MGTLWNHISVRWQGEAVFRAIMCSRVSWKLFLLSELMLIRSAREAGCGCTCVAGPKSCNKDLANKFEEDSVSDDAINRHHNFLWLQTQDLFAELSSGYLWGSSTSEIWLGSCSPTLTLWHTFYLLWLEFSPFLGVFDRILFGQITLVNVQEILGIMKDLIVLKCFLFDYVFLGVQSLKY